MNPIACFLMEVVRQFTDPQHRPDLQQEHLLNIDHLRTEVHLRSVGQKDPLLEFKHEAFTLFDSLTTRIKQEIAHALFKFEMIVPEERLQQKPLHVQPPRRRPLIDLSQFPELEHISQSVQKDPLKGKGSTRKDAKPLRRIGRSKLLIFASSRLGVFAGVYRFKLYADQVLLLT